MALFHLYRVGFSSTCSIPLSQMLFGQIRCLSDAPKKRISKVSKPKISKTAEGGRSKEFELTVASLDAAAIKEPPITEEEKIRRHNIGRNYVIGRFREHNKIEHDLSCKIKLKQHALKMLPKNSKIREEAFKINREMPPAWRRVPVWTPPIPNFDPSNFIVKGDNN
jgi:Mitochondrial ribosomal protein L28